jgi:poly-gamma-glutamate biosynthesis protein PgsC/CapC
VDLNLLSLSIGIGLVLSLLFSELFGLAAGGLVVPGYMALYLGRPVDVAATIVAALLTFFLVRITATFLIVYGRRRTALMILVGYAAGMLMNLAFEALFEATVYEPATSAAALATAAASAPVLEAGVIGYIVPGLIAIWLDRQGVIPTLAALLTSAVIVRLILILVVPEELQYFEAGPEPLAVFEETVGR